MILPVSYATAPSMSPYTYLSYMSRVNNGVLINCCVVADDHIVTHCHLIQKHITRNNQPRRHRHYNRYTV